MLKVVFNPLNLSFKVPVLSAAVAKSAFVFVISIPDQPWIVFKLLLNVAESAIHWSNKVSSFPLKPDVFPSPNISSDIAVIPLLTCSGNTPSAFVPNVSKAAFIEFVSPTMEFFKVPKDEFTESFEPISLFFKCSKLGSNPVT